VGILVLRIVRRAAQILTNSGCLVKVLELLLELDATDIHNFLLHTQFEVEPMAGIGRLSRVCVSNMPDFIGESSKFTHIQTYSF
jgi:hypothetical protein